MAKLLNPQEIEAARKKTSRAERREQQRQLMLADIERNKQGEGVIIIPPPPKLRMDQCEKPKLRVAAYCRVSTQEEHQLGSFEMQVRHFRQRIEGNPEWELVDIYQDEGISGTTVHKRLGFQRMINDAVEGKIDLILTKSINRFGRNVVDILNNLRLLSSLPNPVTVEFEMDGGLRYCGDGNNNLIIAILSAVAEMESQQKSESIKAGIRWRMEAGVYKFAVHHTLGYYRNNFGEMVIEPTEAKIVEYIYDSCLEGATPSEIAAALMEQGIKSPWDKERWLPGTIRNILRNEKYYGGALMQKTYTKDFRTHRSVKNTDLNMYYKKTHHKGIIDREEWDKVQRILDTPRKARKGAKLRKLPNRFVAKRIKDGLFKGFYVLDPHWTTTELEQFLAIIDDTLNIDNRKVNT